MTKNKLLLLFTAALLTPVNIAFAAETTWSGFLSASIGKTLDTDKTYLVDPLTNASYTDEWQSEPESMIGLQATSVISDKMRTTVQMLAKGNDQWNVNVDLAFLSYSLTDTVTLNMGRFRLPFYHYSSFIDVGYAYHWVRPPMDYYSIPHTSLDGASMRYADYLFDSDVEIEAQAWYGNSNIVSRTPDPETDEITESELRVRKDMGIALSFTWEWLKWRLLHNEKEIGFPPSEEFGEFPPSETEYDSIGFMVDYESVIFRSEYSELSNDFAEDPTPSFYLSAGYQIGNFLPHITFSRYDTPAAANFETFGFDLTTFELVPNASSTETDTVTDSVTIGVRWDVHANTAVKAEYITRENTTEIIGFLDGAVQSSVTDEINVFALSVDVVF